MENKDKIDSFLDEFLEEELEDLREAGIKSEEAKEEAPSIPLEKLSQEEVINEINSEEESVEENEVVSEDEFVELYGEEDIRDYDNEFFEEYEDLSETAKYILEWEPPEPKSTLDVLVNEWISTGWIGFLHVDQILSEAIMTGASDVHITAGQRVSMTRNGEIIRYDGYVVPDQDVMHILIHEGILTHQEQAEFNKQYEYDGAYTLMFGPFAGRRTRINVGKSFGNYFIVFRIINDFIPSLEDLEVEQEIVNWSYYPNGLMLLCGPTGTGKTTTLASVVHNLQLTTNKKIVSIEKPIEYIYPDDTPSLVVQREVGGDTRSFYDGLTSAMRQNPDVILLGEVRNTEEVTELLRAAETGHLAISTMHTNSVATTINRIQNLFTGSEQRRIMSTLADTLRGIGNQVLVKDKEDGRFAVRELLTVDEDIKNLIIQGDVRGIRNYQIENKATMEHKLAQAVIEEKCLMEEALKQASDPILFNKVVKELGEQS